MVFLNPAQNLPPELLAIIFEMVVAQNQPEGFPIADAECKSAPWSLTRVCQRWRHAAVSLPSLWTSMTVSGCNDFAHKSAAKDALSLLEMAIQRSGGRSLSVAYREDCRPICDNGRAVDIDIFKTVSTHATRLETLSLTLSPPMLYMAASLPLFRLETLVLDLVSIKPGCPQAISLDIFSNMPKLHTLRIHGTGSDIRFITSARQTTPASLKEISLCSGRNKRQAAPPCIDEHIHRILAYPGIRTVRYSAGRDYYRYEEPSYLLPDVEVIHTDTMHILGRLDAPRVQKLRLGSEDPNNRLYSVEYI